MSDTGYWLLIIVAIAIWAATLGTATNVISESLKDDYDICREANSIDECRYLLEKD